VLTRTSRALRDCDSARIWHRFYRAYCHRTRRYLCRLPCRGEERDQMVWDVLVGAFASCARDAPQDEVWTSVRAHARDRAALDDAQEA
jgi:hypothetical protein